MMVIDKDTKPTKEAAQAYLSSLQDGTTEDQQIAKLSKVSFWLRISGYGLAKKPKPGPQINGWHGCDQDGGFVMYIPDGTTINTVAVAAL